MKHEANTPAAGADGIPIGDATPLVEAPDAKSRPATPGAQTGYLTPGWKFVRDLLERGAKAAAPGSARVSPDEIVTLREYNEALVRKLEKKQTDLDAAHQRLAEDTRRREAVEASLRESQARLELANRATRIGPWDWNLLTHEVHFSAEWKRQLGYEEHEIGSRYEEWESRLHPDDRDRVLSMLRAYHAGERPDYEVEFRLHHKDGSYRWIFTRGEMFRNAEGKPSRMFGCHLDITGRKRAEVIKETMLFLATRLSAASTPSEAARIIFDAADRLWEWDAGTLDVYSPAEDRVWAVMYFDILDGKRREVVAARTSKEPSPRMRRIMRDGPELMLRTPPYTQKLDSQVYGDTTRLSASLLCVPIRSQGRPVGVLSIQSYTPNAFIEADLKLLQALADDCGGTLERLRATEALRASEDRLRTVVETIDEVVWVGEPGRIEATYLSPAFERIWGRPVASVMAHPEQLLQTVQVEDRPRFLAALEQQAAAHPTDVEYRIVRPDGGVRWIWDRAVPVRDASGRLVAVNGIAIDVTERRQAEEAIRRLNAELELRVAERTARLAATNRELEAFSHSISHDLRAPLRHIEGFISMAVAKSGDQIPADVRRQLQNAVASAKQMNQLIDDLLAFSRASQAELHAMPLDLNHLVREVIRGLAHDTQGRAIEWNIQPLPEVRADRALLRQVWANLIGNALKFTRYRQPARIEIGGERRGCEVVVFIRDNGAGFEMHYVDRLFGVFQRLHSPDQFEGTGIGLANVQRIIQRHGGRVWAEGRVDEGATFHIALPSASPP